MFPICDTRDEGIRIIAMLLWIKGKNEKRVAITYNIRCLRTLHTFTFTVYGIGS